MKRAFTILSVALLLGACSPHPGAGHWVPEGANPEGFTGLSVQFDGKAEFYVQDKQEAVLRCFWGGESARTISMDCVVAELISGAKTVGVFTRSSTPMEK